MPLLEVKGLNKRFGGHYALNNVSLTIEPGEVHALVGENGAGKSTFIKIITGVHNPDGGEILWNGQTVKISSPRAAHELGINVIHQDRHLIPAFNGIENVFLGSDYPSKKGGVGVDWHSMRKKVEDLMKDLGIEVPLDVPAMYMTPPERTLLEILRAMLWDCKLLFLDEPTASLTDQESELLFGLIGKLVSKGTSIIYVSHRLDEVFRLSDRITVLRNGNIAGTLLRGEANKEKLISLMTDGTKVISNNKSCVDASNEPILLQVSNLSTVEGKVKNANLQVHRKEILGIFGLGGSGRTELLEAIYGLRQIRNGEVFIKGSVVSNTSPSESLKNRMVLIPEERREQGVIMSMTIRENMTLPVLSHYTGGGVIKSQIETADVKAWIKRLQLKSKSTEQKVMELSGGNQQKVVFAKALMLSPELFLCDEPTQGVDIMTRDEIHKLLRSQAEQGQGVIYVSSDLQEVLEVADRLIIMRNGETVANLMVEDLTPDEVLKICYHHEKEDVI